MDALLLSPPSAVTTSKPRCATHLALTARDAEVLGLVAHGPGNADIADHLSPFHRTVEQHLRHA